MARDLGTPRDELLADKQFGDLGVDSLDVVEIRIEIEREFGLDLEAESAGWDLPRTLSELTDLVLGHLPPEALASLEAVRS